MRAGLGLDRAMTNGPDFLCIGQQKAGTTWLYDQLQFHPGFWMPPVKELHYLCGHFPHRKMKTDLERARGAANKIRKWQVKREAEHMKPLDERDFAFFDTVRTLVGRPFSFNDYDAFFSQKGALLSGDISPSYGPMKDKPIAAAAAHYPELKVILFVRDPVERTWSNINKGLRAGSIDPATLEDEAGLAELIASPAMNAQSRGTAIFHRWSSHVGPTRIRAFLFDDIAERPSDVLGPILDWLGAAAASAALAPDYDRKQHHKKVAMPERALELLIRQFRDELAAAAELFGGAAKSWPARYGL